MPNVYIESFYRSQILDAISETEVPPFTIAVAKLPNLTSGILTITPQTEREELFEYTHSGTPWTPGELNITKRGIKPEALALTLDWTDYNNTTYMKSHTINDSIRGDINNIHINQVANFSPNTLATESVFGTTRLSVAPATPSTPIAVGDNDWRLVQKSALVYASTNATYTMTWGSIAVALWKYLTNDSAMVAAANKITIPTTWVYCIGFDTSFTLSWTTPQSVSISVLKNWASSLLSKRISDDVNLPTYTNFPVSTSIVVPCVANDTFELRLSGTSWTNVQVSQWDLDANWTPLGWHNNTFTYLFAYKVA